MMRPITLLLFLFFMVHSFAQKSLVYENYTYEKSIQSVQLTTTDGSAVPVVNLNTAEKLLLSFDELKATNDYFQYTYVFCDADWNPTDFDFNVYCKGMPFGNIDDFTFSKNTYHRFVHYQKLLPNDEIQLLWAGNYLLKVYRNFDINDLVITRRFMVLNRSVNTVASIKPATDAKYRNSRQELDVEVEYQSSRIPNPMQDVKVVYQQNNRWDNAIRGIRPQYNVNSKLSYNYEDINLFNGVNEFRMFDTRSLRKFAQFIASKRLDSIWHCSIIPDEVKSYQQYLFWSDFNGRKAVANKDQSMDANTDADYAEMYFSMPMTSKLDKDIYIFGELTDWQIYPQFKMIWNEVLYKYELKARFKQGIYNYIYVTSDGSKINDTEIEGNHSETENDYAVWVYNKNILYGYDELIGMALLNSAKLGNR